MNLNRVYEDEEGNIIETCKYGRFCFDSYPRSVEIMDELENQSNSILLRRASQAKMELMQDCNCDCFPSVDYYCRLCPTDSSTVPTNAEVLIQTMPHIPIDVADLLVFMQPDTVRHIIESHYDLATLVTSAQPDTLVYVLSSAPNFSKYLSKMSPHAIYTFLHKIPYPCEYLQSIRRVDAENVVCKVPMFEECLPKTAKSTTTEATETTYRPPPDVDSLFKEEELEQMIAKLPDIKKYLTALRNTYPDLMKFFTSLNQDSRQANFK